MMLHHFIHLDKFCLDKIYYTGKYEHKFISCHYNNCNISIMETHSSTLLELLLIAW